MKTGYVYILTNKTHTTLYVGVTSDLFQRIVEHREKKHPDSFTARYNIHQLVYWKAFSDIVDAIALEKKLKGGSRQKKLDLINTFNPGFEDLFENITDSTIPF